MPFECTEHLDCELLNHELLTACRLQQARSQLHHLVLLLHHVVLETSHRRGRDRNFKGIDSLQAFDRRGRIGFDRIGEPASKIRKCN